MDSVRFGRALGIGARAAAKTLVTAVDAAAAPNPSAARPSASNAQTAQAGKSGASEARFSKQAARTTARAVETGKGLKQGGRRFGRAVWGPFVKLSGVLWLEVTGVFFGIFALFAAGGAWKMHDAIRETALNHVAHTQFLWAAVMAVVFGYFCATSFLKARRRGRGR